MGRKTKARWIENQIFGLSGPVFRAQEAAELQQKYQGHVDWELLPCEVR